MMMDLEVFLWAMKMFRIKIIGPIAQKLEIAQLNFLHFSQNWPTSTNHNLVIFHHMDAILDFLEAQDVPYTLHVGHFSIWSFYLDVKCLDKKSLFVHF